MSFYRHRKLEREQSLPKILLYTLVAHSVLLCTFFLIEKYFRASYTVLFAGYRAGGATVSFVQRSQGLAGAGIQNKAGGTSSALECIQQAKSVETHTIPMHPKKQEVQKEARKSVAKKPIIKRSEQKTQEPPIPLYSELKREYSTLKTGSKAQTKGLEKSMLEQLKNQQARKEQSPKASGVKKEPIEEKKVEEKKPEQKKEEQEVPKDIQPRSPQREVQVQEVLPQAGLVIPVSDGPNSNPADGEILTVDFGNTTISDVSVQAISIEIGRYFRKPLGFDDHKPFTISFEIAQEKACNVSPHGSEPLVLYAALKEAILKATFSGIYMPTKVELVY